MTAASRKQRGAETQRTVATYLSANGWPYATDAGAGRPGRDILGVPGIACEVKARRDYSPLQWLRQATATAAGDLPIVVHRPDGLGPASVAEWPVTLRLADAVRLLRASGYGDPMQLSPPGDCPNHKPVQHRDGRPPWCDKCGLTADYQDPGPKLGGRINR